MNYDEMLAKAEAEAKKIRKKAEQRESNLQERCIEWFDNEYTSLRLLMHHSPNEAKRSGRTGKKLKDMGMRAGYPDLIFTMPSGIWCSLAIEMKEGKGSQRPEQKEMERVMLANNVCYIIIKDVEMFKCAVKTYMKQGNMFQFVNNKVYAELLESSLAKRDPINE